MITLSNYKDIGDAPASVQAIIRQIELYKINNNFDAAYELMQANRITLQPYVISNESFNKIEQAINDVASDVLYTQAVVVSDEEPTVTYATNSEWLMPY